MSIYEKCVRRPVATLMCIMAVMALGMVSLPRLPIDFLPNIERNMISVNTSYSGAGPQEIERLITEPMERAMSTINNVTKVSSTSKEGSSSVRIEFAWGTNMDAAMNDVRDKVGQAKRVLPDDADEPTVFKFDTSMIPVMTLTVTGDMSAVDLKEYVENELRYRFEQIPGVAAVDVSGGETREIKVDVNAARLASLGLPVDTVVAAIKRENRDVPGGYVEEGDNEFLVRGKGEFLDVHDIGNVIVSNKGAAPVYVRDVANVYESVVEKRSDTRLMGRQGVLMTIRKQSGENTVKVA
ncbi:MAG TPA: efflux RND transporter permease subunit, partial [bacterium]|nr:efflux RND transporter permease subunit [bacterium]